MPPAHPKQQPGPQTAPDRHSGTPRPGAEARLTRMRRFRNRRFDLHYWVTASIALLAALAELLHGCNTPPTR